MTQVLLPVTFHLSDASQVQTTARSTAIDDLSLSHSPLLIVKASAAYLRKEGADGSAAEEEEGSKRDTVALFSLPSFWTFI